MKKERLSKAERTRRQIIEEAAILFNQKGYAGTSMRDIMDVTRLSKGALYGNFKHKEEIAVAAFEHAVKKVAYKVGERTRVIENTLDKLKTVVYFYKERILNPPVEGGCPIQNTAIDADDNNPILRGKVIEALDYWQERIIYTIQKGQERNEVKKEVDATQFAIQFIGALEGGIMLSQLYKDVHHFNVITQLLLHMIDNLKP